MKRKMAASAAALLATTMAIGVAGPANAATVQHETCVAALPTLHVNWNVSVTLDGNDRITNVAVGNGYFTGISAGWSVNSNSNWSEYSTTNDQHGVTVWAGGTIDFGLFGQITASESVSCQGFWSF
jgi:hypothetical protein